MPQGIDLPACANQWTEQDRNRFNKLDYYFAKTSIDYFQHWTTFQKFLKPISWTPNMGPIMRGVRKVPAPILRSEALPNSIQSPAMKDVIDVTETVERAQLYHQYVDSDIFNFLPSFQDFLTDHIDYTLNQITEKSAIYQDLFLRTGIFHGSPKVWVAGKAVELTDAPYWKNEVISKAKTAAFLKTQVELCKSGLTLRGINKMISVAEHDIGIPYFSGSIMGDGTDGTGLKGKYLLLTSTEAWNNFQFDEWLTGNRALNLDIVTSGFTGSLFGHVTAKFERFPIRIAADGSIPAPQTRVIDANAYNNGETVINPTYAAAPFEVAFLIGAEAYKSIRIGPPPSEFAKPMTVERFKGMDWSGKVEMTQNFLISCFAADGTTVVQDTNNRREYVKLISTITMGLLPIARNHIIPIIFARQRTGAAAA